MDNLEKLKIFTGESDERLLSLLLSDAKEFVLSYTGRSKIISQLEKPIRDLALISYNRLGTEGETGRSDGGGSYSFDNAPKHIYDVLNRYRLVRIGGKTFENKTELPENILSEKT